MFAKTFILLCAVSVALCQIEQGIFAQLYYPPLPRYREVATTQASKDVASEAPKGKSPEPPALVVVPLERVKRSGFGKDEDKAGNDAVLESVRSKMQDPTWAPEILPRGHNFIDTDPSDADFEN